MTFKSFLFPFALLVAFQAGYSAAEGVVEEGEDPPLGAVIPADGVLVDFPGTYIFAEAEKIYPRLRREGDDHLVVVDEWEDFRLVCRIPRGHEKFILTVGNFIGLEFTGGREEFPLEIFLAPRRVYRARLAEDGPPEVRIQWRGEAHFIPAPFEDFETLSPERLQAERAEFEEDIEAFHQEIYKRLKIGCVKSMRQALEELRLVESRHPPYLFWGASYREERGRFLEEVEAGLDTGPEYEVRHSFRVPRGASPPSTVPESEREEVER